MRYIIIALLLVAVVPHGCERDMHVPVLTPTDRPVGDTPPKILPKPLPPV